MLSADRPITMSAVANTACIEPETNDILTGHISSTVWRLTWPSAIALGIQTLSNNIDRWFVAQLGGNQIAALGLAQNVLMLLLGAVVAISAATTALVARHTGAGNHNEAEQAARQSLYFAAFGSLVIIAIVIPTGRPLLSLMAGHAHGIVSFGHKYLLISLVGMIPLFMMTVTIAAFRGIGDMFTPVILTLSSAVLTALLDWVLVLGHLGATPMGLPGAAWSSVISRSVACVLGIAFLYRSPLRQSITLLRPIDCTWLRRLVSLGLPAGLQSILRTGASIVYFSFLGKLAGSESAMAALTLGLGIEAISYMPGFAFSAAAAAMVGQNLGAKEPERASHAAWACTKQSVIVMTIMAILFYSFAGIIASYFTRDAEILRLTVSYLRINALSEPFIALSMTLTGALQGAGDTRSPAVVTFLTLWIIRLPLTYWLAVTLSLGAVAAWWTMSISMIVSGLIITGIFATGRWKAVKI